MHIQKACPSGRPYFKKMYTFAGIFFRWFYAYTCMHSFFFSYHFAGTLSPPGSGHFSTVPLYFFAPFQAFCSPFFCTSFSSYIIHRECRPSMKSIWEEKSCKIKKEKYVRPSIKILYKQRKK